MTLATWPLAAAKLGVTEGGYWYDPVGGPTYKGITLTTLRAYARLIGVKAAEVTVDTLKTLTDEQANIIWKSGYWDRACCDRLPIGLDYAVFDIAINSDPSDAVKMLQTALGLHVDGIFGKMTEAAAKSCSVPATIARLGCVRAHYLVKLKNWKPNSAGWAVRVAQVTSDAIALA